MQRTEAQKVLIGGILTMFFFHGSPLDLEKPLFGPFQNRVFKASRRQAPSGGFHNRSLLNNYCPAICLNRLSLFPRRGGLQQERGCQNHVAMFGHPCPWSNPWRPNKGPEAGHSRIDVMSLMFGVITTYREKLSPEQARNYESRYGGAIHPRCLEV